MGWFEEYGDWEVFESEGGHPLWAIACRTLNPGPNQCAGRWLQEGVLLDVAAVRRQVLKLTRTSWTHTYEAVTAAFLHAADCVAWQIGAVLAARYAPLKDVLQWCSQVVCAPSSRFLAMSFERGCVDFCSWE